MESLCNCGRDGQSERFVSPLREAISRFIIFDYFGDLHCSVQCMRTVLAASMQRECEVDARVHAVTIASVLTECTLGA